MATGGKEIIPQTGRDTGLLPNRVLALWPYTRLDDHRLSCGNKYIIVRQDSSTQQPLKLGIPNENGWAAYFNHGHLFVKYYHHNNDGHYPDFGVSYETYTTDFMLEMETLSPLTWLEPDFSLEHAEKWELFDHIPMPSDDEDEIDKALHGKIRPPDTLK